MYYIDIVKTVSTEQMWWNLDKYFWSGGLKTIERLTYDEFEDCIRYFSDCNESETIDQTELNDFFWFEDDQIEELIGRKLWED